ncbi:MULTISPECIES: VOC family protein [unclassified Saccharopolyspora]|uniref:VOC family protein n=1 Tax=unclassified Saccharopolyspora TaxID=2646250 RepID=UPI001CD7E8E7|nr:MULTISPECIES: VOC family protein [unclassified Saccharopolyspora]MCA1193841.1 VOC family protein [Saccharopolyspora sp. 6V]MCA1227229.1 VOC family protein [Saccharopolyspora sp. 6M]
MAARFDHTIIASTDPAEMAEFYRDLLEADEAPSWGPFVNVRLTDGVLLQFAAPPVDFPPQHYAFLLDDAHFDRARARIADRDHWADPQRTRPGEINTGHGGRGVYLLDPSGHFVELLTSPYL